MQLAVTRILEIKRSFRYQRLGNVEVWENALWTFLCVALLAKRLAWGSWKGYDKIRINTRGKTRTVHKE